MMRAGTSRRHGRWLVGPCALIMSAAALTQMLPAADPALRGDAPVDANRPYGQELQTSAAVNLVLAVAGSLAVSTSTESLAAWDPRIAGILGGAAFPGVATVAIADLQATLFDPRAFAGYPYAWRDAPVFSAPPGIAADLKLRGLSMVARANGHALDWGIDGMRATSTALDEAGLLHAGTGEREGLARMATFLDDRRGAGRVALLSTALSFRPTTNALSPRGAAPGRPGVSALDSIAQHFVPEQQRDELRRMACRFQDPGDPAYCARLPPATGPVSAFGSQFGAASSASGNYTSGYNLNMIETASLLRYLREAKQHADLVALAVHGVLPGRMPPEAAPTPALVQFAHAAVDAGADLVMVTGGTEIGPIEIYQRDAGAPRPIFYGMGYLYWSAAAAPRAAAAHLDSIIVRSNVTGSTMTVDIYPVNLRAAAGEPAGSPRLAEPQLARGILQRLQRLSATFGTDIHIDNYGDTLRGRITVAANPAQGPGDLK